MTRWPVRHPILALVAWAVLLVGTAGAAVGIGGSFNDTFALPGVQSTTAQDLLTKLEGSAPDTTTVQVVWSPATGDAAEKATEQAIEPTLQAIAGLGFVACVAGPYGANYGTTCPKATPTDLKAAVLAGIRKELAKKTGIPQDELGEAARLLTELAPLKDADPARLAAIARVLPAIARVASAPKQVLDTVAAITPKDLQFLVGLDKADVSAGVEAVGGLDAFANLPPKVRTALAEAGPADLAAFARRLPADIAGLTKVISGLSSAAASDPALAADIADVAKSTGLTKKQVRAAAALMDQIAPLAKADPARLAVIARALPDLASLARADKATLDKLAALTPADLSFLVGLTKQDIIDVTAAFGDLRTFADLPAATLASLAAAKPAALAALARGIPKDVAKATKAMAQVKARAKLLGEAAEATQKATSAISPNGKVAYATVTLDGTAVSTRDALQFVDTAIAGSSAGLTVGVSGAALEGTVSGPDSSEGVGLVVAIIILLIAFGSLVAAGLPIVVALTGLVAGQLLVLVAARFMDVATFAPTLAAMIGLGVGIDYALFVLNRFHQGVRQGLAPKDAVIAATGTAGKAVAFAGTTVMVALLGMFVLRITFFNGLAVAAAAAVLMVMLSALWMLPALLSLLGGRALSLRMPWARHPKYVEPEASRWAKYASLIQRMPAIPAALSLVLIGFLAAPALSMQMGFPDDSSEAPGTPLRVGFDLLADGFGPGVNGPFFVAVQTPKADDYAALGTVVQALEATPGVASTIPSSGMLPLMEEGKQGFGSDGTITSVIVRPSTAPSDEGTADLLDRIRTTTAGQISADSGATIYVGGTQAVSEDFTTVLVGALPLFLLLVVGLGFLALMLLFHSLLIPLTAAVTSLLSFAAALGITVAVFQWGVADSVLGVGGTGPILPFLPIMVFAILFGLSMDYQVFLVTRMREEWQVRGDNRDAVRLGLAGSGRVVVIAATIMTSVFLSFVPTPVDTIKVFGVALASAVIIDAFVVRLVLVPSLMSLFGKANWWLPRWLDKVLPTIRLE
ncbi:MAG: MMPL family transporter [Candidatus Nanopelagicales bacterium]